MVEHLRGEIGHRHIRKQLQTLEAIAESRSTYLNPAGVVPRVPRVRLDKSYGILICTGIKSSLTIADV